MLRDCSKGEVLNFHGPHEGFLALKGDPPQKTAKSLQEVLYQEPGSCECWQFPL